MREGGCVCGAVRYRVKNAPFRTGVCHCRFCQRRTGSAFGIGVYFRKADFELLRGELHCYEHRSDESSRWLRMEFCPKCGTTVTWTNNDNFTHSVRLLDTGETQFMKPGESVTHAFATSGLYQYDCSLHPKDMQGSVLVGAGSE